MKLVQKPTEMPDVWGDETEPYFVGGRNIELLQLHICQLTYVDLQQSAEQESGPCGQPDCQACSLSTIPAVHVGWLWKGRRLEFGSLTLDHPGKHLFTLVLN